MENGSCLVIDIEVVAVSNALSNREVSRPGEGERDGKRDDWDDGDTGVFRPEENEDSESWRKKGDVERSSGMPSSSAYRSCEMLA